MNWSRFTFILLYFCLVLDKINSNIIISNQSSTSKSLRCSTLDELNFGLKFLKSLPYDPTTNQVFSPLALKLSLFAIASVSSESQAKAIYRSIYNNNFAEHYDGGAFDSDKSESKIANESSSSIVRSSVDPKVDQLQQQLSATVETTTQEYPEEHKLYYMRKTWKNMTNARPSEWWSYRPKDGPATTDEFDLWLCISFDEVVVNETVLVECLKRVKSGDDEPEATDSPRLTHRQNIELCRSFGLKSYFGCLQVIDTERKLSARRQSKIRLNVGEIRECSSKRAWQLARIHHHSSSDSTIRDQIGQSREMPFTNNFIFQLLFTNSSSSYLNGGKVISDDLWASSLDWYGLKTLDLLNTTQMREWVQFKRNTLSGLMLAEFVSYAAKLSNQHHLNHLLDIVMFDQKFADDFRVNKRKFYGPKSHQNDDHIYQIETLQITSNIKLNIVQHRDPETNANHTLVMLPYVNHRYSLVVALPHQNSTIPDMLRGITSTQLASYLRSLHSNRKKMLFDFSMPRFSIGGKMNLTSLRLFNITDFSLKTQQNGTTASMILPLENVQQFIRVTNFGENGRNSDMLAYDPFESATKNVVRLNRPFMYMLVSKQLDLDTHQRSFEILVAGFYNGPEQMLGL